MAGVGLGINGGVLELIELALVVAKPLSVPDEVRVAVCVSPVDADCVEVPAVDEDEDWEGVDVEH